jgi:Zn-dependent protease with chaperone function
MRYFQAWVVVALLTLLIDVLSLPFSIYSHSLSLKYGLSIQHWGSWFWDWTKSELIGIIVGVQLIALLYWLIRKSPKRWWLYAWVAVLPIMVFVIFVVPVVLDPLFNKFEPLEKNHADLVQAIHKVTERGGLDIPSDRMFLMLASEKVTTANAYVTGIGATKRVVVWDTTTQQMTIPQTLFVFGHEMGHYMLRHIAKGLIFAAIMLFFGFWIAFHLIHWLVAKWGSSWQIRDLPDWASLPALLLIASLLGFVAEPIGNAFSRHIEHEADVYGLNITRGINSDYRQTAAQSFQSLGEHSLSYPYPSKLMIFWLYNHPDIPSRVQFALHYEAGQK